MSTTQLVVGAAIVATVMYAASKNKVTERMYYEGIEDEMASQMPVSKWPFIPIENILLNPGTMSFNYHVAETGGPNTYLHRNGGIARGGYKQEELAYHNAPYGI